MAGKWRGKGNQAIKPVAQQPQVLELQFHERANSLFELMMNFNTQPQQLDHAWREVMELRNKCLKAYGNAPARGGTTAAADGGPAWKSEFYSAYARKHKTALTKDDISFEILEVENSKPGANLYVATLTCNNLAQTYQGGQPSKSKKEAEHEAAKAAIKAEFPAEFKRLNAVAQGVMPAPVKGQKRKAEVISNAAPQDSSKSRLTHAVTLMVGSMQKGDIAYECVEEGGQFTATVVLQAHDPSTGYQGLPAGSKKDAESAAAEAALNALADQIAQAEELHAAKKKKKAKRILLLSKQRKKPQKNPQQRN